MRPSSGYGTVHGHIAPTTDGSCCRFPRQVQMARGVGSPVGSVPSGMADLHAHALRMAGLRIIGRTPRSIRSGRMGIVRRGCPGHRRTDPSRRCWECSLGQPPVPHQDARWACADGGIGSAWPTSRLTEQPSRLHQVSGGAPGSPSFEPWGFKRSNRGIQEPEHSTPLTASIAVPAPAGAAIAAGPRPSDRRCPTNRGAGLHLRLLALPQCERPAPR